MQYKGVMEDSSEHLGGEDVLKTDVFSGLGKSTSEAPVKPRGSGIERRQRE